MNILFEIDATGEKIEASGATQEQANSNLLNALIERFKGEIPAGKVYGLIPFTGDNRERYRLMNEGLNS